MKHNERFGKSKMIDQFLPRRQGWETGKKADRQRGRQTDRQTDNTRCTETVR